MNLNTGKLKISELLKASECQDTEIAGFVNKNTREIVYVDIRSVTGNKKKKYLKTIEQLAANGFDNLLYGNASYEYLCNPDGFCRIPDLGEAGIADIINEFTDKYGSVSGKMRINGNEETDKFLERLDKYLTKNDLWDKWYDFSTPPLTEFAINWCRNNNIEYINDLAEDYRENYENASYIFSVSFCPGCYRHIKISSRSTLFDLHEAIIDAYGFCDDHAHAFFMNNKAWDSRYEYTCPGIEEDTPYTNQKLLAEFDFQKGDKFLYIFDFGDEWRFNIKFLRKLPEAVGTAEVIRSVGEAPDQYGEWYDNCDDE